jgi:hypothetical protein
MEQVPPDELTLDELCRIVPIVEDAAERWIGPADNVITFAACRRRQARRTGSRGHLAGAGAE